MTNKSFRWTDRLRHRYRPDQPGQICRRGLGRTEMTQKSPLAKPAGLESWCPGTESHRRHGDFQSLALPTELPGQRGAIKRFETRHVKHGRQIFLLFSAA